MRISDWFRAKIDGGLILKNGNTTAVPELLKARIHWICSTLINFVLHSKKYYSVAVVKEIKKRFGNRVSYHEFIDNFRQFCDENGIEYSYNVWY